MKKTIIILLVLVMVLSLAACGGGNATTNTPAATEAPATQTPPPEPTPEPQEETIEYHIGDTIAGDHFEITLLSLEFSDAFINDYKDTDNNLAPALKSDANRKTILGANDNYAFLTFSFQYKFIGKTEYEDTFHQAFEPTFIYGGRIHLQ